MGNRVDVIARDNFVDIDVVTNCAWTLANVPSWIQPDPSSGQSGTTRSRVRINANNTTASRTAETVFRVDGAQTSLVINQEAPPQPITYTGSGGSATVMYSPTSGNGDKCTYTTTLRNISVSVTVLEETVTAGEVRFDATETANIYCTSPPAIGASLHIYSLSSGTLRSNSLDARFSPASGNRPQASVQVTGTRSGTSIDATIDVRRTDSTTALNWRVTPRLILTAR